MTYVCDEEDCAFCAGNRCRACESAASALLPMEQCTHSDDPMVRHRGMIAVSRTFSETATAEMAPIAVTKMITTLDDPQGAIEFLREVIRVIESKIKANGGKPIKLTTTIE